MILALFSLPWFKPYLAGLDLLKELPDEVLQYVFWKIFIECEVHALTDEEKIRYCSPDEQFQKNENGLLGRRQMGTSYYPTLRGDA